MLGSETFTKTEERKVPLLFQLFIVVLTALNPKCCSGGERSHKLVNGTFISKVLIQEAWFCLLKYE